MGCDIHAHVEIKVNDEWRYYAPADLWRNYAVFSKMAGVRNDYDIEPIAQPRELPSDVSFMTKMHDEKYGTDAHSHSWLSLIEIAQLIDWFKSKLGYKPWGDKNSDALKWNEFGVWLFGNSICGFLKYPEDYPCEDVRLVFWFEN